MELRQLHCLIAVAETLNFRRAAERLHVTQPSVSRHIRQLEEELNTALFIRDRRQVQLTENGRSVLAKAKALVDDAAALAKAIDGTDRPAAAALRVGVGIPLARSIQSLVTEFARQFSQVDVQYRDIVHSASQNQQLRKGEIDVGVFWPPIDRAHINSERLFDEHFRVILPKASPLARRKRIRFRELADQMVLLPEQTGASNRKVLQMAQNSGVSLRVTHTTALPHEAGAALVAAGKGIYVLPGTPLKFPSFGSAVISIPLDEPISLEVHMAWRKDETSAAVFDFLATARKVFRKERG